MRHKASLAFFEYWNGRRGDRPAPIRRDIAPADLLNFLPSVFILERGDDGTLAFRLAGTGICNMLGRELKGSPLSDLWLPGKAGAAATLASAVLDDVQPAIVELTGESQAGRAVSLELLMLPVAGTARSPGLVFGVLTPKERPYWMDLDPIIGCITQSWRLLDPSKRHALPDVRPTIPRSLAATLHNAERAAALKRLRHLTLLQGGRHD